MKFSAFSLNTVKGRLVLLLAVIWLMVALSISSIYLYQSRIGPDSKIGREQQLALLHVAHCKELNSILSEIQFRLLQILDEPDAQLRGDSILELQNVHHRAILIFDVLITEQKVNAIIEPLQDAYEAYQEFSWTRDNTVFSALESGHSEMARMVTLGQQQQRFEAFTQSIATAESRIWNHSQDVIQASRTFSNEMQLWIITIITGLSLLISLFAWKVLQSINRPLAMLVQGTRDVEEGYFNRLQNCSLEELNQVIAGFNKMNDMVIKRYNTLIESAPNGIVIINSRGVIVQVNPALNQLFGYEHGELEGETLEVLVPMDVRSTHVWMRDAYIEQPSPRVMSQVKKLQGQHKSGELIDIDVSIAPLVHQSEKQFMAVVHDTSNRVKMQEDLELQKKELEEAAVKLGQSNADLERFAYICSHDLQEPVRTINSFTELLSKNLEAKGLIEDPKIKKYIDYILSGSALAREMVTDVLRFCQVDTEIETKEEIDVLPLLESICSNVQININERQGHIELDKDSLNTSIAGIKGQVRLLFLNLINNGLKFNRSETPTVSISARTTLPNPYSETAEGQNGYVLFEVKDNGIGIPDGKKEEVFEVFKRLNKRSEFQGTGIGLAMCKRVVDRHQGTISIEDADDQGTLFKIRWPLLQESDDYNEISTCNPDDFSDEDESWKPI